MKQHDNDARVTHSGVMYLQFPLQGGGILKCYCLAN
jgi:hypothetical protein